MRRPPSRPPASPPTSRSWWPTTRTGPDYVSRGGHKLAGALAAFEPRGLRGRRSALPGRRRLDRRVHRRPAAARCPRGGGGRRRATASSPGGCSRTSGCVVHDRTNVRDLTLDADRRPGRPGGRRPVLHLAGRWCSTRCSAVTAPDGDLALMVKPQFEVGKDRVGKGGVVRDPALRAEAVRRRGRGGGRSGAGVPGWSRPARCRGRRATSSSSCGCGAARRRVGRGRRSAPLCDAGLAAGAPGEKVDP